MRALPFKLCLLSSAMVSSVALGLSPSAAMAQDDPPVIWATPSTLGYIVYDYETQAAQAQEALATFLGNNIYAYKEDGYFQGATPENQTRVYFPAAYQIQQRHFTDRSFRRDFLNALVRDGAAIYRHNVRRWQKYVRNAEGHWEWQDVRDSRLPNPPPETPTP